MLVTLPLCSHVCVTHAVLYLVLPVSNLQSTYECAFYFSHCLF